MIHELKQPQSASRSDIIKRLQQTIELARKERIELLELRIKIGEKEYDYVHIDGEFYMR